MKQHAMQTAMTLYENGTLELQTAANQAGVSAERLRRAVHRTGGSVQTVRNQSERLRVSAD